MLFLQAAHDDIDIMATPSPSGTRGSAGLFSSGRPIHSGHHQAEEQPGQVADALLNFLADG